MQGEGGAGDESGEGEDEGEEEGGGLHDELAGGGKCLLAGKGGGW